MDFLFGRKASPEEILRRNQKALNKAMRELDRETIKMEHQEKKLISDIKKNSKIGQIDAVKILAKDLVRTRKYIKKFMIMKANIQGVSLKIQTLKSQNAMAQAMKGVTKAMNNMNKQMKLPEVQRIMADFEKQSEIMSMKEDTMNEVIDDLFGEEDEEEESEVIVNQVMDELGLQLTNDLERVEVPSEIVGNNLKTGKLPIVAEIEVANGTDADLQARLDQLRKD